LPLDLFDLADLFDVADLLDVPNLLDLLDLLEVLTAFLTDFLAADFLNLLEDLEREDALAMN
jgi:hypothetical protein